MTIEEKAKAYDNALGIAKALYDKGAPYSLHLKEMFPVLKESEDGRIRKKLISWISTFKHPLFSEIERKEFIAWLEKQDEEKHTGKIEPKFKVGDWIVSDYNNVAYIESISETNYNLQCKDGYHEKMSVGYIDKCWRLWTIQDAKDGDILTDKQNCTCIFREIMTDEGESSVDAYCGITIDNEFVTNEKGEVWTVPEDLFPATKEQRDLLFHKMKEAGYEWDAEKKELKKIEQKPSSYSTDRP